MSNVQGNPFDNISQQGEAEGDQFTSGVLSCKVDPRCVGGGGGKFAVQEQEDCEPGTMFDSGK